MVSFDYEVHDAMGLHARPVGRLVKAVSPYKAAKITIKFGEKVADAKRMFAIMALQVKQGQTITVTVEGEQEEAIAAEIQEIFKAENL